MKIKVTRIYAQKYEIETGFNYTSKQLQYIEAIENFKMYCKKIPTIREIAEMMEVNSPATVETMIKRLRNKGYEYTAL